MHDLTLCDAGIHADLQEAILSSPNLCDIVALSDGYKFVPVISPLLDATTLL